jgi:hypothetical protein
MPKVVAAERLWPGDWVYVSGKGVDRDGNPVTLVSPIHFPPIRPTALERGSAPAIRVEMPDNKEALTMRYETIAQLAAAYASGELDRTSNPVVLDNDSTNVFAEDVDRPGEFVKVFSGGGPEDLLREVLDLLGVPYEDA